MARVLPMLAVVAALTFAVSARAVAGPAPQEDLDAVFSEHHGAEEPGCALGVMHAGEPTVFRAYGSADLEHGVLITPDTIFEAGSVSKQFTAAAALTLVAEGRIRLDDRISRYFPELPRWADQVTVSQLFDHTSGLRDWGAVVGLAGWPRSERVYGMADVLAIMARQQALNYEPGTRWAYTNTGFNLLAMLVERVSGQPFAAFTRERLFRPLGMSHTGWRDDFRRVVPGRAVAYEKAPGGGWRQRMPFEDVVGNGGLLTTVGDLLIWNEALTQGRLGDFVTTELQRPARLSDGRAVEYARGLFVDRRQGLREVFHSGATAGYRAWLGRWPDQGLSVALLCNAGDADAEALARRAAARWLPPSVAEAAAPDGAASPSELAGWWASDRGGAPLRLVLRDGALWADGGQKLATTSGGLRLGGLPVRVVDKTRIETPITGDVNLYRRVESWAPTAQDRAAAVGRFRSDEAGATWIISEDGGRLRMTIEDRPEVSSPLEPAYRDAFTSSRTLVRLIRDRSGKVTALRVSDSRVWDLVFPRLH